uniref:Cingulin n=1 Tax=Lygus hesperus TaxID=30085 RepID=A0A0A9Z1G4_LYGHE
MTDLLYGSSTPNSPTDGGFRMVLRDGCRSPVIGRYSGVDQRPLGLGLCDLKHSKSDDLVLQSAPISPPEIQHGISEASLQIQREACVVYEDDLGPGNLPVYFSDSETLKSPPPDKPPLKITGDFGDGMSSKRSSQYIHDRIDPEDSIKDIISENDFYRFVLFKRHYEKYLDISKKYEEARNIAYYLEEKYHEMKAERDCLAASKRELERQLEGKDVEMHEKEDELFLHLEKAIRLEEDCEKLKVEKEKIGEWKDKLEREKNEAYRQLKLQAEESEATRRRLERARNDVVRQVTAIVAEKDSLERENSRLKDALRDIEGKHHGRRYARNLAGLEKEVSDLKLVAKQSATLNSQLKKGMKHLASCRRRKCSVCAYTRSTFGDYHTTRSGKQLLSCFHGGVSADRKLKRMGISGEDSGHQDLLEGGRSTPATPELSLRLSHLSLSSPGLRGNMSYIDEGSSDSDCEGDTRYAPTVVSNTSSAPHAFSSDSGFSSEICDPSSLTPTKAFTRATKWTSSFRKLIRRVSKSKVSNTS